MAAWQCPSNRDKGHYVHAWKIQNKECLTRTLCTKNFIASFILSQLLKLTHFLGR